MNFLIMKKINTVIMKKRGDMMNAINILLIAWFIFLWILLKSKGRD